MVNFSLISRIFTLWANFLKKRPMKYFETHSIILWEGSPKRFYHWFEWPFCFRIQTPKTDRVQYLFDNVLGKTIVKFSIHKHFSKPNKEDDHQRLNFIDFNFDWNGQKCIYLLSNFLWLKILLGCKFTDQYEHLSRP